MKKALCLIVAMFVLTGAWWSSDDSSSSSQETQSTYTRTSSTTSSMGKAATATKRMNPESIKKAVAILTGDGDNPEEAKARSEAMKRLAEALKKMSEQRRARG